jgi:hypothetical protein
MRKLLRGTAALAGVLAVTVIGVDALTARTAEAAVTPAFISSCLPSHTAGDDPIVMPGMPGMAMRHDFFGNTGTNANSTTQSLVAGGGTTCGHADDKAAYWAPTATLNGKDIKPIRIRVYYRAGTKDPATVKSFPVGLKMVAGEAYAKSPQPTDRVSWGCGEGSTGTATVPTCPDATLVLHVYFPDCWDGKNLDSPDHRSHMAYTHNGQCPSTHPVPVPKLTEDVKYPVRGGAGIAFQYSGSPYTGHADFMNGWKQSTLDALVKKCINGRQACGVISG